MSFLELIRDGGWPSYLVLLLGGLALAASFGALAASIAAPKVGKWIAGLALLSVALLALAGIGGRALGVQQVERAVANVNPTDRLAIMDQGYKEAGACVTLALYASPLPLLLALAALAASWRRPEGRGAFGPIAAVAAAAALVAAFNAHDALRPGRTVDRAAITDP